MQVHMRIILYNLKTCTVNTIAQSNSSEYMNIYSTHLEIKSQD
jgi:hypothetical protein